MREIKVSAPGKIILAGEHAVVYGYPALVGAVGLRCRCRLKWLKAKKIQIIDKFKDVDLAELAVRESLKARGERRRGVKVMIESELPIGGGLGSSAAMATAVVWAALKGQPQKVKEAVVKLVEDKQHRNNSGVDQTIVREGRVIKFQKNKGFKRVKVDKFEFLLIDSGRPVESTGEMVEKVSKGSFKKEFTRMGEIAENWRVDLIRENQRLLEKIGAVGETAKKMVREIEKAGGVAKACGGGGVKQGSGILLSYHQDVNRLMKLAKDKGWQYDQVELGVEGVRYEKD